MRLPARTAEASSSLTSEEVAQAIKEHAWIYAKTMPQNPHEYTLRKQWGDDALFDAVVTHIREHGYETVYQGRKYIQLDVGEFFYWTMGSPLKDTILINRKRLTGYTPEQIAELKEIRR